MSKKLGRKLRLGMVGGGPGAFIGEVHRIAARFDGKYELVAAALSSNAEKSKTFAAELGIPRAYGSFAEMAEVESKREDGIDVVAIVTPNDTHYAIAKAFLDAGIHVMCDKPMTTTLDDAIKLAEEVERSGLIFALTHTYSGYPIVRQMRSIVESGVLGKVRMINVEYVQGWLATPLESSGSNKQAEWRTDPKRSGPAGCLGDIGTHAYHLAYFVGGLEPASISADLTTFVEGRRLDDNVQAMIRYEGGAKASLWSSQIAIGNENNLNLRIYGEAGSLEWNQENPNYARYTPLNQPTQILSRGGGALNAAAARLPAGHPEGYFEAFAQLYADLAERITARLEERDPAPASLLLPTCQDGVNGLKFIEAALRSSANQSSWTSLK
ncbi:Gfo/Idh/MocA family oxidoreductase [Terriglobus albidus]|uniref:Gfo/Idh/MocA family oxidoreductase n=1 Tax=Terriglobus albidus TaxID=1592106 RepID=A0A5B9EBR8_9BACT|nr:Gfo/Idh/MocA family oxidoreductase [Terriglobus albidus]QEE28140.1 Gfo/Idh/MocA family oxidoreductase [Terriglobus albidus]